MIRNHNISGGANTANTLETSFAQLPARGRSARAPWSQSYWSFNSGGLQRRYQTNEKSYTILTRAQVASMNQQQLNRLSPTEKYDILMNHLKDDVNDPGHFVATKTVRSYVQEEEAKGFELGGFCHAYAPLAVHLEEPGSAIEENISHLGGKSLQFYSADIAALLTLNQHATQRAALESGSYQEVGRRCPAVVANSGTGSPILRDGSGCQSINAGTFHMIVTNQLGRLSQALMIDTRKDLVVLNEMLHSYDLWSKTITDRGAGVFLQSAAAGTARVEEVVMTARFIASPRAVAINGRTPVEKVHTYKYRLELDAAGKIIGGSWHKNSERPDFIWTVGITPKRSSLPRVFELYEKSLSPLTLR